MSHSISELYVSVITAAIVDQNVGNKLNKEILASLKEY
jgi:hypothetical protein